MEEKSTFCEDSEIKNKKWHHDGSPVMGGGFYFLTFVGVAVYYLSQATTLWMGVVGILKAMVWPAMLIFKVFTLIQM